MSFNLKSRPGQKRTDIIVAAIRMIHVIIITGLPLRIRLRTNDAISLYDRVSSLLNLDLSSNSSVDGMLRIGTKLKIDDFPGCDIPHYFMLPKIFGMTIG